MDGFELGTNVLRGAARLAVELEAVCLGSFLEAWLRVGGVEGIEELLVWC
jgi:hypothetical protein